jgi:pSer/pThr/pTyr-binding forkhead associated (FHA) protein
MKSFLAACGVEDSLQLVVESQSTSENKLRPLFQPFAIIGRDARADVALNHFQVSRRHVYLQVVEGRAFWIDLESRTGTRGESEPQKAGWLEGNQALQVGPYVIRRFGGVRPGVKGNRRNMTRVTPLRARMSTSMPLLDVSLEFLNGPAQSTSRPVHRVLSLIGSANGCKFRLTDPSVSRFHCSLLQTSAGLWIVDLLGQRGITVNEVPVRSSRLVDRDVVRIGRYQIRVRCRIQTQRARNSLFDLGRTVLDQNSPRQDREPAPPKSPDWTTAAASFEPAFSGPTEADRSLPTQFGPSLSKVEVMTSDVTIPVNLAHSGLTSSLLAPLISQFGLMQQQMFDQFQQAMSMVVQMFGTMHRDQMEVIRAELDRLHELTEEFHALKQELASRSQGRVEPALSRASSAPARSNRSVRVPEVSSTSQMTIKPRPSNAGGAERSSPGSEHSSRSMTSENPGQRLSVASRPPAASPSPPSSAASPPVEQLQKPDRHRAAEPTDGSHATDSDRDTVAWLHQRIMALHHERESRWQRILKLIPGMSSS